MEYNITKHAEERYAKRIQKKDEIVEIQKFILEHKDKIKEDINQMISYGTLIYSGPNFKDKNNIVEVYLKDFWVVFADPKTKNVITLYKIDFGAGEEFNKSYLDVMLEKIDVAQKKKEATALEVESEISNYNSMIAELRSQIKEYRTMIHNMESLCADYEDIVKNISVKETQAEIALQTAVNGLVGKREF